MPLTVEYDPLLIALSVAVAVIGSFGGLRAIWHVETVQGIYRKVVLAVSALAIGTSIWSMHFIGMLAVRLPVQIEYDVLITLVSALVSILMTGIGLAFAVYGKDSRLSVVAGGVLMGLGISCMHYIGMSAIRANCTIAYSPWLLIGSVAVGIVASTLTVWLFSQHGRAWSIALAALMMGLAISGMHYTAMAAATFLPIDYLAENAQPVMQSSTLAFGVAVSTFLIVGFAVLCALPSTPKAEQTRETLADNGAADDEGSVSSANHLPVERNKAQVFLEPSEIIAVKADGRYSTVFVDGGQYFCGFSISEVQKLLDSEHFLRVHRSYIVNLSAIESFERHGEQGNLNLKCHDRLAVPVSRANVGHVRGLLHL